MWWLLLACASKDPTPPRPMGERPFWEQPPAGTPRTERGIAWQVLQEGTGDRHPTSRDRVTVHYAGWTGDGTQFDSSYLRGQPATFGLDEVIPGWTFAVQQMVEGEKTRFWIPGELGYGYSGNGPVGQLVFDIELIDIVD